MINLKVKKRDISEKTPSESIPAVFYGPKEKSTSVMVDLKTFEAIWKQAGESSIISLEGVGEAKESLIHDVQVHPVSGSPIHVDFYVIERGKKLTVKVPLEFVGESLAVKNLGGTLVKALHELEIEVLPRDLPQYIEVDISVLNDFDSHISVADLSMPEGVTALFEPNESVASVSAPKEEEIEEGSSDIDMESIEVEKKGKEDDRNESDESDESGEKKKDQ